MEVNAANILAQAELVDLLEPNPALEGPAAEIAEIAQDFYFEAKRILDESDAATRESAQFTIGMQKLLEAKDCFVRVAVLASDDD